MIIYRDAQTEDAAQIVAFYNRVGGETEFLSFGENQYPMNELQQRAEIDEMGKAANSRMLLALDGDEIVGIVTVRSSQKERLRHCGGLGIVVSEGWRGRGIGTELMTRIIRWARDNGVTSRLVLDTRTDNRASALYERLGFEHEGVQRKAVFIDGIYYDLYNMAMIF